MIARRTVASGGFMRHGLLAIAIALGSNGAVVAQPAGIQRVAWLQGCWEAVSPERTIEEQWMAPRGGAWWASAARCEATRWSNTSSC